MKIMKKMTAVLACSLALLVSLTACGGSKIVGTWYSPDDSDIIVSIEKDGRVLYYDSYFDETTVGSWEEDDDEYILEMYGEEVALELDEDALKYQRQVILERGDDVEVPLITLSTLTGYFWEDEATEAGIDFYDDGSWEMYDSDYDTIYEGGADGLEIDGDEITLYSLDGEKLTLKVSEDAEELEFSDNDMTFVKW